jgi:hypothetical protein
MIRLRSTGDSTVSRRGRSWRGFFGLFLTDPLAVPWSVVEYVAVQLDVPDPSVVKRYTEREKTAYEHAWEIRAGYGYRDFADPARIEDLPVSVAALLVAEACNVGLTPVTKPGEAGEQP